MQYGSGKPRECEHVGMNALKMERKNELKAVLMAAGLVAGWLLSAIWSTGCSRGLTGKAITPMEMNQKGVDITPKAEK